VFWVGCGDRRILEWSGVGVPYCIYSSEEWYPILTAFNSLLQWAAMSQPLAPVILSGLQGATRYFQINIFCSIPGGTRSCPMAAVEISRTRMYALAAAQKAHGMV
jgi:hypothetical protein